MKQWFTFERHEFLVLLVFYPVVFFANYLILGQPYFDNMRLFIPVTGLVTGLYVLFVWLMDSWMKYMRHRYTELDQTPRRIAYCLLFYVVAAAVLVGLIFWLFGLLKVPGYRFDPVIFRWTLLIGFISNLLCVGIFESIHSYRMWKESVEREYALKQLHMQRQLDVLKQQVNPHFLFNSLNSLISLIGENPQQAEVFAEELSSVYRYVLQANRNDGPEHNLTDLDTELAFVNSYYHLLKTRYGTGLALMVAVDKQFSEYKLPPLTLQLLIENAVKHNVVMVEQPLLIEIKTDQGAGLCVRNTLQKKPSRVLSNGVGLTNILTKYQMLGQPVPTIEEIDGQFVVTLPLIKAS
ncbi:sensor histidine kinase [Spirosoma validum]|uniref:Histidine kinase n=1 Tax=Spirosoma validum TaxID=2771355 RepID=A0A927B183_9BACT|nr:histidine kinase [Spirosoma validum]MBD2753695.1 histidine kinase [Spirosoma validum]